MASNKWMLIFTFLKRSKISAWLFNVCEFLTLWGKGKGIGHGGSFFPFDTFLLWDSGVDSTLGSFTLEVMVLSITLPLLSVAINWSWLGWVSNAVEALAWNWTWDRLGWEGNFPFSVILKEWVNLTIWLLMSPFDCEVYDLMSLKDWVDWVLKLICLCMNLFRVSSRILLCDVGMLNMQEGLEMVVVLVVDWQEVTVFLQQKFGWWRL